MGPCPSRGVNIAGAVPHWVWFVMLVANHPTTHRSRRAPRTYPLILRIVGFGNPVSV